ncbi:MAG: transcriptional regulator [Rhizobiaceae bacterium]|nr:transcriptional regulator [Rhizobiaceae bacterium]
MPSVPYREALRDMAERNPEFADQMLEAAVNAMLAGDLDEGRIHLRDYVTSTIGFQELAARTGKIDKNLMRTLGPKGSPTAANLFQILQSCTEAGGVKVAAHVIRPKEPAEASG